MKMKFQIKNLCIKILKKNPNNYEALLKLGLIDIKEKIITYMQKTNLIN